MGVVFALGRVVGSLARLGGRYRLARWIGFCVAVFALILVVGEQAHAATSRSVGLPNGADTLRPVIRPDDAATFFFRTAFYFGLGVAIWCAVGITLLGGATLLIGGWDWLRSRRDNAMRDRDDNGAVLRIAGGRLLAGLHDGDPGHSVDSGEG